MAIENPTAEQQAWLDALDRMGQRSGERGRVSFDTFAAQRCLNEDECPHLVAETGVCPVPSCGCTRHESRSLPLPKTSTEEGAA